MVELKIKLKRSYVPENYFFGCSRINNIDSVTNWQSGDSTIEVNESGVWFCFAKKKSSNKYSVFTITVDCLGTGGGTGGGAEVCTIYTLHPYILQVTGTGGDTCIMQVLPPTILLSVLPPIETGLANEIEEIFVPIPEFLNQVDFRFLGDFDIPLHPAPKFADQRIIENVLKGRQFRHQNTVGDIFKKGFTGIDVILCRLGTERQTDPYSSTFQGVLNIKKTSVIDGGPSYPQLHLNNGKTVEQVLSINYADYVAITNDFKTNIPKKFSGTAPEKYNGRMVLFDIENEFNSIPTADFVNRTIGLYQAIKDGCGPDVKIGFMYQGSPLQHTGFGVVYENYLQADPAWTQVSTATANATAKGFPTALLGKSFATMDANMMAVVEYYLVYESFVPENSQLYARNGDKLKDYNGNILPLFTHFGKPQNNAGLANYKPSYLHPFAHTAGALGVNRKKLPAERLLILQTNLFNALTFHKDFGGTPEHAIIKQTFDGFAVYNIPNYIVAGIEAIAFFSGALYYLWEDATDVETPVSRNLGLYNPLEYVAGTRRLDYHGQGAVQAMAKRLATKSAIINNVPYRFKDLIDGTERYLLDDIEVDYLTVPNFSTVKKINPLNWMEYKLTPVMGIVNEAKGLIAFWFCPAFFGSGEPKDFDVYYRENGHNFKKRLKAVDYKNSLMIFKLNESDSQTTIAPPTITKNVTPVNVGDLVILTSAGCVHTSKWYKEGTETSVGTGSTITISAENGVGYFARCENGTSKSIGSNVITFSGLAVTGTNAGSVTVIQPVKPANFFTGGQPASFWLNRANLPTIFTNTPQFDPVNDVVKMKNSEIEIWIDLKAGGQICYASLANSTKNLVYIGSDRGFQWQADYTQHLVGGVINGQTSGSPQNNSDYNTTQGGDYLNHGVHLLALNLVEGGFYTKVRPILYPFNSVIAQVEIETTYVLIGSMLRVDYKYTSFRTDPHIEVNNAFRFKGFDLPVMFCLEEYSRYGVYVGKNPWTGEPLQEGDIPNTTGGQNTALGLNTLERWGMIYNPANDDAIGVYNATTNGATSTLVFEQLNKYPNTPAGTNIAGAYTVMKMSKSLAIPDGGNFIDESRAYITFGNRMQVRNRFNNSHNQLY